MEGDAPAHPANRAALRTGRPDLPSATAAGVAAVGLRQPQNLTALRRGRLHHASAAGSAARRPLATQRIDTGELPTPRRRISIPGLPPAALMVRSATSSKILAPLRKHLVFLDK